MEIETIEAVPLRRELDGTFANAQKWIDSREYCLVRIETVDGTVGWGECWGPVAGNRELIEEYVAPWLTGQRVDDVERIHDELVFKLRSSYHSFVPVSVVSGIDIALWDAYGKSVDRSVSRLLGGRYREEVRAYATGHFFRDVEEFETLQSIIADEARGHVDAGFTALKQKIGLSGHFPWGPEEDIELVRTVREAVGDEIDLMVDANHAYDIATAKRVACGIEDLDVRFFEEPVRPEIAYYSRLKEDVTVPIAGGESWAFQHEFNRVLSENAADYVQPDVTSAGGITSTERVATLADSENVQCLPHVFGSAIALAASLQVIATIPGEPMLEFDRTPNPIREDLAADPITNDGDVVRIRDRPGLGIEIDEAVLESFRADG
ncbi:mandelate racemase/muconate lactonizing enzyme family protein [Natronomonas sp. F2-12]|jgi:D-galactarolactone cycloisomerase|uniref:Mandelate racemase/muconate lactonizing enzyme family protein n=1 Tax=Natronomonas aquatica TaxID=2841590 RepID=A0A9R1D6G6_9EURY|nr:mandelate racemase/muconate lactonizing enzyme family protein [Natronomonas aquatica]MCQ4333022.1 mandelate racemase/muconate lactonizing enzyme family protein [Natronomonas aquatica]